MKSQKITSIAIDENDNILNSTYDYVSEKGIKITLNGKNDIVSVKACSCVNGTDFTVVLKDGREITISE